METQEKQSEKITWWIFVNSKFGLFLFGSVVLVFITNSFSAWKAKNEAYLEVMEEKLEILSELKYRIYVIDYEFHLLNVLNDSFEIQNRLSAIENAYLGKDKTLLFPNKPMVDLFAMYLTKDHSFIKEDEKEMMDNLHNIKFLLNRLHQEKEYHEMIDSLEHIRKIYTVFKGRIERYQTEI